MGSLYLFEVAEDVALDHEVAVLRKDEFDVSIIVPRRWGLKCCGTTISFYQIKLEGPLDWVILNIFWVMANGG